MKPSEMTDQELIEAWFVEAHGWHIVRYVERESWEYPAYKCLNIFNANGEEMDDNYIPYILDSEEDFNRWVLPVMKGRGLSLWVRDGGAEWVDWTDLYEARVEIKNNRRLRAAVEGALRIVRGEK